MQTEALLTRTFAELAGTLVAEFDVVDLLTTRCVEILGVSAAGVMLSPSRGDLQLIATSSEPMGVVELFELQNDEGPCLDCYRSGEPVLNQDLATAGARWPHFAPVALEAGFRMVHALPMRLGGAVIGALNLFGPDTTPLDPAGVTAGQAMADFATIAILDHRAAVEAQTLNQQLTHALNSRIVIEQAKGVLVGRCGVTVDEAFSRLRRHARSHNLLLSDVAEHVIDGTLSVSALNHDATGATGAAPPCTSCPGERPLSAFPIIHRPVNVRPSPRWNAHKPDPNTIVRLEDPPPEMSTRRPPRTPSSKGASPKGNTMYISLGTILIIILLFLLFRGVSGRRA